MAAAKGLYPSRSDCPPMGLRRQKIKSAAKRDARRSGRHAGSGDGRDGSGERATQPISAVGSSRGCRSLARNSGRSWMSRSLAPRRTPGCGYCSNSRDPGGPMPWSRVISPQIADRAPAPQEGGTGGGGQAQGKERGSKAKAEGRVGARPRVGEGGKPGPARQAGQQGRGGGPRGGGEARREGRERRPPGSDPLPEQAAGAPHEDGGHQQVDHHRRQRRRRRRRGA